MDINEFVEIGKFASIKICGHSVYLGLFLNSCDISDISIIPSRQKNDIYNYTNLEDRNKRFIARKKLYFFLKEKYRLECFDFETNNYNKPKFKYYQDIHFSFSYAKEYIFTGVSSLEIGIDIEYIDKSLNVEQLAHILMHPAEFDYFSSLAIKEKREFFFRVFSVKEAILKAIGIGLYYDINSINILNIDKDNNYCFENYKLSIREFEYISGFKLSVCLINK
ncbi:4'-phosphopantetheinyl transferase family protein [Francisella sp. TX07-6608]|uniref:4'-phosphopantetheinyl transferase family protein n=1 Tax=Francisella sp. TX07-6608 TaxID=573568 RepID=UPI0008F9CE8F|nr:4'-phosphopantetheinyl transferase superfamily protein [Francisella sp. TX07-6608]OIN84032.1 4'-phosphopantetheinyl transferase superfamily protein [Francisella sp. TX07-6608]